jgi:hypothetical protein
MSANGFAVEEVVSLEVAARIARDRLSTDRRKLIVKIGLTEGVAFDALSLDAP